MTGSLKVNTDELRTAAGAFTAAGDKLAGLNADVPLGDAAAAVPQLQTASACNAAKATVASELSSIAEGARAYGANLDAAASKYESTDQRAGGEIAGVQIPDPAS